MFDLSQDKWFVSWQAKDVVKVEPSPLLPPTTNRRENDASGGGGGGGAGLNAVASASPAPGGGAARAAALVSARASSGAASATAAAPATVGMWLFCFPWAGGSPSVFEALSWQVSSPRIVLRQPDRVTWGLVFTPP